MVLSVLIFSTPLIGRLSKAGIVTSVIGLVFSNRFVVLF